MDVVDLDQLFEDYGETDLLQHFNDPTADRSSSDDLAHLFDLPSSNESDLFGTETILDREEAAWHKAPRKCEQNPASPMLNDSSSFCIDSKAQTSLSDSELLSFEDLFELERNQLRSISQPSTPRPHTHTTRSVKKAVSFNDRATSRGVQKSLKKSPSTSFAKMMQPMYYRSPIPDVWTRKMDTPADAFHLRGPSSGISSPPLSSKIVQHENGNGFFAQEHHQAYTDTHSSRSGDEPHTPGIDFSNYQLTPQASPGMGVSSNGSNHFDDHMGLTFSSSASSAALSALQTPPSSLRLPMTTWGTDTSPSLDFGFSASPEFPGSSKTAGWWNDDAANQGSACPGYRESNSRSTSQTMGLVNGGMNGLGISCDTAAFGHFSGLGVSDGLPGAPAPSQSHASHHRASHSSTASSRRKSSNSSQQSSRQLSSGNVGFVNFTPDDSRKILTGVAPSGSSKTKARREKEAAEKRRKLSQAAMKAVMEAGGDVDSLRRLEREGLLVLEN
ncbi:uncharacterized protein K460DRAFT_289322 [Cucurbitaria berberidis CBS 394.84]|uniref:Developmental regulatory protein wetA n=1 Tax=Cucurbitaria berberidis CBS 394.84 TaxID=1168544 RepID=A0A9P4GDA7_9PLEO|nr:uncharacterized protein K460DRAFT_289322 [Cucurbitaria berberidis CBS 394.84]KAF1843144.1 hypothetical protein K460DRAFT_289322 [Cucurbitaria berberidis CBS 394.84]